MIIVANSQIIITNLKVNYYIGISLLDNYNNKCESKLLHWYQLSDNN